MVCQIGKEETIMAKGFWDDFNKKQKKIMEEQEKANKGKTYPPVKVGTRTPVKKPAKKK